MNAQIAAVDPTSSWFLQGANGEAIRGDSEETFQFEQSAHALFFEEKPAFWTVMTNQVLTGDTP